MAFDLLSIVKLAGGLALFLYGMSTMGNGLEQAAGAKLESTLEKVAGNLFSAFLMGAAVTAVIQSSSATTVMVVGFVNAGIMTLQQAVGIIMGANIGTTITGQILRLDSGAAFTGSPLMTLIKPSNLAYLMVLIGILYPMLSKRRNRQSIGNIFVGFGVLFIGMSTMEAAVAPLKDLPGIQTVFATISNPILGILVGAGVTALIQSSSASVGILHALSTTGAIPYSAAIPIILGQNIGTCITAFLSSLGGTRNARRTAMIHFYFNLFGSVIFIVGIYAIHWTIGFGFWNDAIDKGAIANFHTLFNVVATAIFLPFSRFLVFLAERTIPSAPEKSNPLIKLEPRFLETPTLALEQARKCIADMGTTAMSNTGLALRPLFEEGVLDRERFDNQEAFLDRAEVEITRYLMQTENRLPESMRRHHTEMLHSLGDFEKIGDYAKNIMEKVEIFVENGGSFSDEAMNELHTMYCAVEEMLSAVVQGYICRSSQMARAAGPLEDIVDTLKGALKTRHIDRLGEGLCTIENGLVFLDIVHDLEKIGDHANNIMIYTVQLCEGTGDFDTHDWSEREYEESAEYRRQLAVAQERFLKPLGIEA